MVHPQFKKIVQSKWKFNLFLLKSLPAAFFSGVRVVSLADNEACIKVKYKWFSRNPFGSTYFACLAMAGEMASGILALGNIWKNNPKVSMLVLDVKAQFYKKAVGETVFTCADGELVAATVYKAIESGEGITQTFVSKGVNLKGEAVADILVTWSFKVKK